MCVRVQLLSHVQLFVTPWIVAHQALLSMGFSRQEDWSGLSFPSPGDLPDPGIEPRSPASQGDSLPSEPAGKPEIGTKVSEDHDLSQRCFPHIPNAKSENSLISSSERPLIEIFKKTVS